MDAVLLDEVAQIQQDLRLIQAMVENLQARLNDLTARLQKQVKTEDHPLKFTDLEGIWAGMDLSYEEIYVVQA